LAGKSKVKNRFYETDLSNRPQGRDQLGGRLRETRKWIGATEIVAFLTANRVRSELVDFHVPSARDGTHPKLFQVIREKIPAPSGTDVMIFKIFSPKNWRTKLPFLAQNKAKLKKKN
jgi:hypothetical protein